MRSRRGQWFAPPVAGATAIAAVLLLLLLGLTGLIDAGFLRPSDQAVIDAVRAEPLVAPLAWLRAATELGSTWWVAGVAVVVAVVESIARRPALGVAAAVTIGVAALANSGLKLIVGRARPDLLPPIVVEPGYSFPSGHSLAGMVAYGVAAVLVARSGLPPWVRVVIILSCVALTVVVGLSRIYLGVHYPSDVVGGWLAGLAAVVLFAGLSARLDLRLSGATGRGGGAAAADRGGPRSVPPAAG